MAFFLLTLSHSGIPFERPSHTSEPILLVVMPVLPSTFCLTMIRQVNWHSGYRAVFSRLLLGPCLTRPIPFIRSYRGLVAKSIGEKKFKSFLMKALGSVSSAFRRLPTHVNTPYMPVHFVPGSWQGDKRARQPHLAQNRRWIPQVGGLRLASVGRSRRVRRVSVDPNCWIGEWTMQ